MNLQHQLDNILNKWSLLNHPFYQAWSNGTLPAEKLKEYSSEYAAFIGTVSEGWDAIGDTEIGDVERGHYELWKQFAQSLGQSTVESHLQGVADLVNTCHTNNQTMPSALGGLYAFEAQQPYTSQSKLQGLRTHYSHLSCDETYFKLHENDFDEPAMLLSRMEGLSIAEQEAAVSACENTAEKLWNALTAIHGQSHC